MKRSIWNQQGFIRLHPFWCMAVLLVGIVLFAALSEAADEGSPKASPATGGASAVAPATPSAGVVQGEEAAPSSKPSVPPAELTPAAKKEGEVQPPKSGSPEGGPGSVASLPNPPKDSAKKFVQFMKAERGEDEKYLELRFERATALLHNKDLYREKETRAFLLTPREKFCRPWNLGRAYDHAFLDIHHGVTISGPHLVGRMTSALDVQPTDKVLEIGTGSGYQSAMLTYLTDHVYTIEIIDPLEKETDKVYSDLTAAGYPEYGKIKRKSDDGYYGWEEYAPFDKIIVTCGIDHIPPPLLKQLQVGGAMVIPVGPPGAQVILRVTKTLDGQGNPVISREDIYHGRKKEAFVPFTKKGGGTYFK